jgi:hypothetical protein
MNLKNLSYFWSELKQISSVVAKLPPQAVSRIRDAALSSQGFYYPDYKDLRDWFGLASQAIYSGNQTAIDAFHEAFRKVVVANYTTSTYGKSQGIAFWWPDSFSQNDELVNRYKNLVFARETHFEEVLNQVINAPPCIRAENGQWATSVVGFSSQYETGPWSANQALGACNTATEGDHDTAWAPLGANGSTEYVTVGFENAVSANGAIIRETLNAGFVTRIDGIDVGGTEHPLWEGTDPSQPGTVRDFRVDFAPTAFLTKALKITIRTDLTTGWEEIDSVQLLSAG